MNQEKFLIETENLFLALSDKTRLRILNLLRNEEICVYYLTEVLKESQPKISRHLAYLKNTEIVSARREGKWVYYRIEISKNLYAERLLKNILEWLTNQKEMQEDYEKLLKLINEKTMGEADFPETIDISEEAYMRQSRREELETFLL